MSGTPSHTSFIFQLTTSRRGRRLGPHLPAAPDCFQLTTSRRGRHVDSQNGCMQRALSTHDLTQRSTQRLLQSLIDENLSTHDLTQRSTSGVISAVQRQKSFNSRPHAEVDLGRIQSPKALLHFQLTTSRRGRRRKDIMITFDYIFQLTTSRRGRPDVLTEFMHMNSFNSRPHAEVDINISHILCKISILFLIFFTKTTLNKAQKYEYYFIFAKINC